MKFHYCPLSQSEFTKADLTDLYYSNIEKTMEDSMKNDENRRKDISLFGDVLSVEDISEYMGITKADAQRIMDDQRLKKLSVPIRKQLVNKQVFLEYLQE